MVSRATKATRLRCISVPYATWAQVAYGTLMHRSRVAFVARETIARIGSIQLGHEAVPVNLGDDGCGGDGKIDAVAFVKAILRLTETRNRSAVDQDVLGSDRKAGERQLHGADAGMIDVEAVDLFHLNYPDRKRRRLQADVGIETEA